MLAAKQDLCKKASYPFFVSDDPALISIQGHADPPRVPLISHISSPIYHQRSQEDCLLLLPKK